MSLKEEDFYSREIEKSLKLYIGEYGGFCSDNNSSYDETEEDIARRAIFKEVYNQNNKKNEKNENLNCSKLPEMKLDEEKDNRKKESALVNSVNLFVNEPQSEDKSDVRDYPKIKIKAKTIKYRQVIEDEKNEQKQTTQLMNKKRKPENKNEMNTENKNDNTINKIYPSIGNEIFMIKKINTSEGLNLSTFQNIVAIVKKIIEEQKKNPEIDKEKITKFEDEMKEKLSDVLCINKLTLDMAKNEVKNDYSLNTLEYMENLLKAKIEIKEIEEIFLIIKNLISINEIPEIIKKEKVKKIISKDINNEENKTNLIQNFDETNLNIGLDGNNSDGLNYENFGIQGNKEKHKNIHLIFNIEKKNTAIGSNIESTTSNNNEKEIIERAIRVDHMIDIIKNRIMENFVPEFNKVNKSYKLSLGEVKNEDDKKNVGHKKRVKIKEEKKKEEKKEEDIIIYIKIKHNDSIENDKKFMTTNFQDIIEKAKKKQNYENLDESNEAKTLINKIKKDYLKELLDKNENLFQPNLIDQTNRCINKKCNDVANQIFKTSNLDGLIIIFKYGKARGNSINFREKNLFANEIKNLKGYEKFTLELNKIDEDFLQFYMDELKKIAQNPLDYLVYLKNTKKKGNVESC